MDMEADWADGGPNRRVDWTYAAARVHAGEVLREWIDGHGETVSGTARRLGVSRATLNRVLAGRSPMGPRMAVRLEEMGWSEALFWLTLQMQHDIARVKLGADAA